MVEATSICLAVWLDGRLVVEPSGWNSDKCGFLTGRLLARATHIGGEEFSDCPVPPKLKS
jgi:hypothetical protein